MFTNHTSFMKKKQAMECFGTVFILHNVQFGVYYSVV
jgi:hypothetical protein